MNAGAPHPVPHDVMAGVEVVNVPGKIEIEYIGTRDALLRAGVARPFMFPIHPKRIAEGLVGQDGRVLVDDGERLKGLKPGEKPRVWWINRLKGGRFHLTMHKTTAHVDRDLAGRPLTEAAYREWMSPWETVMAALKCAAAGQHVNNPEGWHLSRHAEIAGLADRIMAATKASTIRSGGIQAGANPFTVIPGGAS